MLTLNPSPSRAPKCSRCTAPLQRLHVFMCTNVNPDADHDPDPEERGHFSFLGTIEGSSSSAMQDSSLWFFCSCSSSSPTAGERDPPHILPKQRGVEEQSSSDQKVLIIFFCLCSYFVAEAKFQKERPDRDLPACLSASLQSFINGLKIQGFPNS